MTEPLVNFRHEYVSGAVEMFELVSSVFAINVANRGATEAVARAVLLTQDHTVKFDGGDQTIAPGHVWTVAIEPAQSEADLNSLFWARILTTSSNLVPSARILRRPEVEGHPPVTDAYFSPGDFAVFELPYRPFPPVPPIGPVLE